MTPVRRSAPVRALALALSAAATGCGIQPTGVVEAGDSAGGLTKALRLYYARDDRVEGVTRPDIELRSLNDITKLLMVEPTAGEQERGLANLVRPGTYEVTGSGARVTLHAPDTDFSGTRSWLANGQWVCTLTRAQAVLDPSVRPDDVQVTLDGTGAPVGPYRCSQFLSGASS
ncbi:hypothetical protein ACIQMR_25235 [Streptomyces sp. NPDC091376]|uniref:hypothetical protein n=1 Tax=Streptomyces sp. NPDC091376 TaxID=3365994 RepID=UPI003814C5ED